jgi:hypothetical protein
LSAVGLRARPRGLLQRRSYLRVLLSRAERFFENWLETARSGLRPRSDLLSVTPVGPFPALNVPGFLKVPSPLPRRTETLLVSAFAVAKSSLPSRRADER